MGYSFRLAARVLLYASSDKQNNTYHSLCGRGAPVERDIYQYGAANQQMMTRTTNTMWTQERLNLLNIQPEWIIYCDFHTLSNICL